MIIVMLWAMIVTLRDIIDEEQSCMSNAPLNRKNPFKLKPRTDLPEALTFPWLDFSCPRTCR